MKRSLLIVFTLVSILLGAYLLSVYWLHDFNSNSVSIDNCMDRGGCWDDVTKICRENEPNAQELCDSFINYRLYDISKTSDPSFSTSKNNVRAISQSFKGIQGSQLDELFKSLPSYCTQKSDDSKSIVIEIQSYRNGSLYSDRDGQWFYKDKRCSFPPDIIIFLKKNLK